MLFSRGETNKSNNSQNWSLQDKLSQKYGASINVKEKKIVFDLGIKLARPIKKI